MKTDSPVNVEKRLPIEVKAGLAARGENPARPGDADLLRDRSDETKEYSRKIRRVSSTKSPRQRRKHGPRDFRHGLLESPIELQPVAKSEAVRRDVNFPPYCGEVMQKTEINKLMKAGSYRFRGEGLALNRDARRELAWQLRYEHGWPVARIAARLRVKSPAISRLLQRAADSHSLQTSGSIPSRRPRPVRPFSLSQTFYA